MSLLVVGSVAYDGIETPFGKVDKVPGGSATYASLSASYFYNPVRLVGVVGKDFAQSDIDAFKNRKVDTEGLQIDKSGNTFFWQGRYHENFQQRDTLDTQLNVFANFDPILPEQYKESEYICLANIQPDLQQKVLDQVENPKMIIMDTMNLWIDNALDDLKKTLKNVHLLVINDEEAQQLSGDNNLMNAAKIIRDMGPDSLIIKKGEHGALLFSDEDFFSAPAFPVTQLYDPTGAGDTFLGGMQGWLAQTDDLSVSNIRRAMIYGTVMASFCVEEFGPGRLQNLTDKEISERYEKIKQLSEIPSQ